MPDLRGSALSRRGVLGAAGAVAVGGAAVWGGSAALAESADAKPTHGGDCDVDPAAPKRQFRASWIATTANIDWPSKPGLDADTQQAEYLRFLDDAREYGFNAVVCQIRPTGDAFWPSSFEPWSEWLTGEQGKDPGYDPVKFSVEESHKAGLEYHAWLNPYRISMPTSAGGIGSDTSKLADGHAALEHPDWVVTYPKSGEAAQLYYNPGIPAARKFVIDAMMDAVDKYDIDGVHFDDYFYPYPTEDEEKFDDDDAFAKYGGDFDNRADWRRNNVDELMQDFSKRIKDSKPWVKFGVSPFGVWRNKADDKKGSDTEAGSTTYDDLYADTRKWVLEGWIDYIAPQIYWAISMEIASYKVLVEWWNKLCADTDCQLYIGEATYKVNVDEASPEWKEDPKELSNHLTLCRDNKAVDGNIYFSAISVREDALNAMTLLSEEHYSKPALLPESSQLGGHRPRPPRVTNVDWDDDDGAVIEFRDRSHGHGVNQVAWYALYSTVGEPQHCDFADATNLVKVVAATPHAHAEEIRYKGKYDEDRRFAVTALNRAWQESKPAISHKS